MKTTVELWGENREVTFNDEDVRAVEINNGDIMKKQL